jgi:deferrochelatase/peroxidase EfeB
MAELQEGIYHAKGMRPGDAFGILFLRAAEDKTAAEVGHAISEIWQILQGVKNGQIADLPGHEVPKGDLSVLIGYGQNAFKLDGAQKTLPAELTQGKFLSPLPSGGGPLLGGSGLCYASDVRVNAATEEVMLQFIGTSELAVNRAVVEVWKYLNDTTDPVTARSTLLISAFYTGFQRDDARSWIDFHDGISNMRSEDRALAIKIKTGGAPEDAWAVGGAYLAFIRVSVDLVAWRGLTKDQQEIIVGRDKLTGAPLVSVDAQGKPVAVAGCPVAGTTQIIDKGNEAFREPANVAPGPIKSSHVHRANHHLGNISQPASARVYRQGYEFLETCPEPPGFRVGLNFVSFQDTPRRLTKIMLTQKSWLGNTNFGGEEDAHQPLPGMAKFLQVRAAGMFVVPPVVPGETFPGAAIFGV